MVDVPAVGRRVLDVTAEPIHDAEANDQKILISFADITDFKRTVARPRGLNVA